MKFGQQFEINKIFVFTKFRGNMSNDYELEVRKPPERFAKKTASYKTAQARQKIFSMVRYRVVSRAGLFGSGSGLIRA